MDVKIENKTDVRSLLKLPSAYTPILLSLAALILLLSHFAVYGNTQNEDEGTAAHIFQLLMLIQLPMIAYFSLKWLPKQLKPALQALAFQGIAYVIPLSILYWLEK